MKVLLIGKMASNGGNVSENLIFNNVLSRHNRIEEICNVHGSIVVTLWQREALCAGMNSSDPSRADHLLSAAFIVSNPQATGARRPIMGEWNHNLL